MKTIMANSDRKAKKRNFTQCETEVLGEVETREKILFGGQKAYTQMECVCPGGVRSTLTSDLQE